MADWIAEIDRIESDLVAEGVPASDAMRVSAMFADALAKADAVKRRAQREREALRLLHTGAGVVAERQGCHRATAYRRAMRARLSQRAEAVATKP
jgi:hypothetical protein